MCLFNARAVHRWATLCVPRFNVSIYSNNAERHEYFYFFLEIVSALCKCHKLEVMMCALR